MTNTSDLTGWTGLQYFGRTTASLSHELKNALAIIRENAGLLNDYLLMVAKGMELKPERLKIVADRIDQQTRRADDLIKQLNRFGHSADEASATVDLNEIVSLLAALSLREISMKQATLRLSPAATPVMVATTPFWLLTLLGRCLTFALNGMGDEKVLALHVEKAEDGGMIRLEPLIGPQEKVREEFPGEAEKALLEALNASCRIDLDKGRLVIHMSNG